MGPKQPWTSHLKRGKICQLDIVPNPSQEQFISMKEKEQLLCNI